MYTNRHIEFRNIQNFFFHINYYLRIGPTKSLRKFARMQAFQDKSKDPIQNSISVSTYSHYDFSFTTSFDCRSASLSHTLKEPQKFCAVCLINLLNFTTPMNFTGDIFYDNYFIVLIWAFYLLTSIFQEDLWRGHLCSCMVFQWLQ